MYNGIGLQTPRGSGTNGHVQRSWAFVRMGKKDSISYKTEDDIAKIETILNREPNKDILDHERKRKIEVKVAEFAEILEKQGLDEGTINTKINLYRTKLMGHGKTDYVKDEFGRIIVRETHQVAEAQQKKNNKLREAFGIPEHFIEGSSFDPNRKVNENPEKITVENGIAIRKKSDAERKRKYSLIRTPSRENSDKTLHKNRSEKKKKTKEHRDPSKNTANRKEKKRKSKKHKKERSKKKKSKKCKYNYTEFDSIKSIKDCGSVKRRRKIKKEKKKKEIDLELPNFDSLGCISMDTGTCQEIVKKLRRKEMENIITEVQRSPKPEKIKNITSSRIENIGSFTSFTQEKKEILNADLNQQLKKNDKSSSPHKKLFKNADAAKPTIQDAKTSLIIKRTAEKNVHNPYKNFENSNVYCPSRSETPDLRTLRNSIFNSSDQPMLLRPSIRLSKSPPNNNADFKRKSKQHTKNDNYFPCLRLQSEVSKMDETCRSFVSNPQIIKMQSIKKKYPKTLPLCKQSKHSWGEDSRSITKSPIEECFNIFETQNKKMTASMEATIGPSCKSFQLNSPLYNQFDLKNTNSGDIRSNKLSDSSHCSRRDFLKSIIMHENEITSNKKGTLSPFLELSSRNSISCSEKNTRKYNPLNCTLTSAYKMSSDDYKSKQMCSRSSSPKLCPQLIKEDKKPKLSKREATNSMYTNITNEKDSIKKMKTSFSLNGLLDVSNQKYSPKTSFLKGVNSINAMSFSSNYSSQLSETYYSSSGDTNSCMHVQSRELKNKYRPIHKNKSKPEYDGQYSKKNACPRVHFHCENESSDDENNASTLENFLDDENKNLGYKDFDKDFEMLENLKFGIAAKAREKIKCIEQTANDKISSKNFDKDLEMPEIEISAREKNKGISKSVSEIIGKNMFSTTTNLSSIKSQQNSNEEIIKTTASISPSGLNLVNTTNDRFAIVNNSLILVNNFSPVYENFSSRSQDGNHLQKPKIAIKPFKISESLLGVQASGFPLKETNLVDKITATLGNSSSDMAASVLAEHVSTQSRIRPKKFFGCSSRSRYRSSTSSSTKNSISSRSRSQSTTSSLSSRTSSSNGSSSDISEMHTRSRSFSGARSPSIPRRRGSPSFLDRRRITSARKRPIPYHRPTSSSLSSGGSCYESSCSSLRSSHSQCKSRSPSSAF